MASLSNGIIVNSRDDLDAIQGTPQRAEFMDMLKGSIYRLEKDDVAKTWVVVKDASLIKQFGFLLKDFPDVTPPELPTYVPPVPEEPEYRIQRRAAYPPIGDQLDAMWKGGEESAAMLDAIMAIKTQFPKPA